MTAVALFVAVPLLLGAVWEAVQGVAKPSRREHWVSSGACLATVFTLAVAALS